ncbi:transcript variant X7 [Nothobranchius furzeri]|uniref:Transcript variant X7 n=2 Tax=Nothobranchius furzeri TaxID=105023 RepID=A0A9D3BTW8_NOTFU|nr:transcript variant X7 [Nothobranchius furzeri]
MLTQQTNQNFTSAVWIRPLDCFTPPHFHPVARQRQSGDCADRIWPTCQKTNEGKAKFCIIDLIFFRPLRLKLTVAGSVYPEPSKMSALPDGVANGPSRSKHSAEYPQIWERPWSLEEIRQHSTNWSLAADSGLFHFLQDFSQRMLSKTHEIEKQLDSLICDTKATDSRLHTVFNDFLMLSNTQFIENRVYDEEVEETISKADALEKQPEPQKEKTREQKEAELIPKMQEAVNYGLKVLESAFEHLDIKAGNSDSEDEDISEEMELILEPKDLYVDRPLPSLIGSQSFMEQDDVGLGDLLSDEVSVDSDRDSVIDSEDDKEEAHSDEDSYQEEQEGHNNIKKKSSVISYDEEDEDDEEEEDSDLFGSDKEDENDDSNNTGPSSFADELAARIKGETFNRPEGDRASAEEDSDDMFKPPKLDDEDFSLFGGTSGLFSRGKGLFDDDDEGDLFSEAPKPALEEKKDTNESIKSAAQTQESNKTIKKIPAGAVSIFPGAGGAGGGGLFDDDEEDDDFFSEKSLKKPDSIVQEKSKPKRPIDLFDDEDDEDGDIFSSKHSIQTPAQTQREVVEEKEKPPERKMPPGAISMFGPATKSLLSEGLKKRQLSTSEESNKSDENAPVTAAVGKASAEQTDKHQTSSLFSDDEEPQLFPTTPKSRLKPEPTSLGKTSKASLSIFDDEEDEDLFAFAAKSKEKPNLVKSSKPQPSSSLFSDDEQDQWMSSKKKPDTKSEGIKTSTSVPSGLPSTKTPKKSSLFDEEEEEDLFASAKDSNQKKPQRVALLFEDEGDDEEGGSLFGIKPAFNTEAPSKTPHATSEPSPSHKEGFVPKTLGNDKRHEQQKPAETPEPPPTSPSQEGATSRKKPAGAVSLFGGIDVLDALTKTPLDGDDHDDVFLSKERPPPTEEENKEVKGKANAVSLFDDDGDEEDDEEVDWSDSLFVPSQATTKKTQKSAEERPQLKSTGVFQDEELLFSQTQQKDNDPDVDLFATSETAASSAASSVKPAAQSLFSDDDEDDLFSSVKSKPPPPKVAEKPSRPQDKAPLASPEPVSEIQKPAPSPVKPKDSSSRIGKLQASLMIDPAALLPGAGPSMSGALSSSSGVSSSSMSPSPVSTPIETPAENERAVSFDTPVQVTTLVSTHKGRVKGSALRRPQSRAARQQAAQKSVDYIGETLEDGSGPTSSLNSLVLPPPEKSRQTIPSSNSAAPSALPTPSPAQSSQNSPRPSELTLPATTNVKKESRKDGSFTKAPPLSDDDNDDDLFGPDGLFGVKSVTNKPTRESTKPSPPQASSGVAEDRDLSTLPSIFDDNDDDLFHTVKPQAASKKPAQVSSFFEDEDDDLFGLNSSSTPTSKSHKEVKTSSSFSKQDIFQDEAATIPKVQKKEKSTDVDLFDDNIDIFADLMDTVKPKQKSKMKGEAKSIFDDAMDDIFSTSTVKPGTKAPNESKKRPPSQEISTSADSSNIFDDPLNALGGN